MCRPVRFSPGRAAYACLLFLLAAAAAAFAEVPPVVTEDVRLQKWGEERTREVQEEGVLFYDADGVVYIGDGVTPGGKAVCVGRPTDLYSWTNDVVANGHALLWGGGWSQQAEGGSLLLRLGTNSWLRMVSASAGELANLFVSDLDQTNGTMRITADTTDPAASMLVATNLLDPEAWQTATNAQIVATTDASTTWLITLLDTSFETYKVRVTTTREAGIHAERTFHANAGIKLPEGQGIEMDGERWDEWPNMANYASNSAVEAVAADLSAHTSATNPHGITAAGIGALTTETDSAALGALNIASNALHGEISGHATRTDNPHNVTAAQAGALPNSWTNNAVLPSLTVGTRKPSTPIGKFSITSGTNNTASGDYAAAFGWSSEATNTDAFAAGGVCKAYGYSSVVLGNNATARGANSVALGHEVETGSAAGNAVAMGYRAKANSPNSFVWSGSDETYTVNNRPGTWNINPTNGMNGFWVGETNMADHIAAAVAPVEARVGALEAYHEWPETCVLWWTTNLVSGGRYYVPTNFQTRRLEIRLDRSGITNCYLYLDSNWDPGRDVEIAIVSFASSAGSVIFRIRNGQESGAANSIFTTSPTGTQTWRYEAAFDDAAGTWRLNGWQCGEVAANVVQSMRGGEKANPTTSPCTVAEWEALYDARKGKSLSASPQLVPGGGLSPAIIQPDTAPLEDLDSLETLENLTPPEAE